MAAALPLAMSSKLPGRGRPRGGGGASGHASKAGNATQSFKAQRDRLFAENVVLRAQAENMLSHFMVSLRS